MECASTKTLTVPRARRGADKWGNQTARRDWSHVGPHHFRCLNWLPVSKRVDQISLCHVFKVKNGLAPDYMAESFIPQDSVHSYKTRSCSRGAFQFQRSKVLVPSPSALLVAPCGTAYQLTYPVLEGYLHSK
ncbi:hypothetical protein DPMN_152160 [Dreissena polymorpha]|uniref:Uncharacterized protein n=1 Tax=Dreissena polymorpha TaxID=45954 RepID=A0A9D4J4X1_DREPO|nr:hypothetical protein DPMN_152160 [Dreissena polymorpha]